MVLQFTMRPYETLPSQKPHPLSVLLFLGVLVARRVNNVVDRLRVSDHELLLLDNIVGEGYKNNTTYLTPKQPAIRHADP